jgi:putative redox protein
VTAQHHVVRAVGSTGADIPAYRVDVRIGRHHLVADEPTTAGGADVGPSPLGLLLAALAACTTTTLRMYAERKGWALAGIGVDVRYTVDPSGDASIQRAITLPPSLSGAERDRLAEIAERTMVTLAIRTPITTTVEFGPAGLPAPN